VVAQSGTYNFLSATNQQFVDETYERTGIVPAVITHQKIVAALRCGNFVLTEWINKGYNLYSSYFEFVNLNENQPTYRLSSSISDIIECNLRNFQRPLGGTAFSFPNGDASGVFGGTTACTQTAPNGYISYNFGADTQYEVTMVGVLTNANLTYTLKYEWSNDGITWTDTNTPIFVDTSSAFLTNQIAWVEIVTPGTAQYFRIRETGGATLNIAQLYFVTNINDIVMAKISQSEWMTYPNKYQSGRPTVFWVDRKSDHTSLTVWNAPSSQYQLLYIRLISMTTDVGNMQNRLEIPARFYDAYCAAVAYRLAIKAEKLDPVRLEVLKKEAEEAYSYAATEDVEKVPLRLIPSYLTGWSYV
jgi:hypothetical protein